MNIYIHPPPPTLSKLYIVKAYGSWNLKIFMIPADLKRHTPWKIGLEQLHNILHICLDQLIASKWQGLRTQLSLGNTKCIDHISHLCTVAFHIYVSFSFQFSICVSNIELFLTFLVFLLRLFFRGMIWLSFTEFMSLSLATKLQFLLIFWFKNASAT